MALSRRPPSVWLEMWAGAGLLGSTVVDLARAQFATTSLYHFLFVPLTLGLAPLVATMQTLWQRTGDDAWLRLTRFFGTLLLINFAIGVATGLVQEFQFGMNWSVYSKYVGNVFGAPLAIEGVAAFFLESTFLGLWIFGWNRLSPRIHLATPGRADERVVAALGDIRALGLRPHDVRQPDRRRRRRPRRLMLAFRARPRRRGLPALGEAG